MARKRAEPASKKPRPKKVAQATAKKLPEPDARLPVRVVGIGASAGGLEALEQFFDAMPINSGLAFAIVQHLSPDFRSMMDELLARRSRMTIMHAQDGMTIERDTLYLNPPRMNLVIENGCLRLVEPVPGHTPNHPIDALFASLARDRGNQAIGMVLSGTGSDGTLGARGIIEAGGHVLAQDPETAKFDSMPRSAIEQRVVTGVAAPSEMPQLLARLIRGEPLPPDKIDDAAGGELGGEADILAQLENRFGAMFGYYKSSMVLRRLNRRANLSGLQDLSNYAKILRKNPVELELLYSDMLIGVTAFFRDHAAFAELESLAIPSILSRMSENRQLRIWVAGCASGEEAYSIAIQLCEQARLLKRPLNVKIFATDLHHASLDVAAAGLYSANRLAEVAKDVRDRHFEKVGGKFRVRPHLRNMIVFSPHNLIKDPPFTRLDLISCRNLLIYFDEVAQAKVLSLFHFALNIDGILFLGPSEALGPVHGEFETLDGRWRIFRKMRDTPLPDATRMLPPRSTATTEVAAKPAARLLLSPPRSARRSLSRGYDVLLQRYAPPSVMVTRTGDIAHVFGDGHAVLSWRSGAFSGRLVDAVAAPLKSAVVAALRAAWADQKSPVSGQVSYRTDDGRETAVEVKAEVLHDDEAETAYALVTFVQSVAAQPKSTPRSIDLGGGSTQVIHERVEELERSLLSSEQDLQTTNEELETANEELQSSNEELMSANEELQATNEELHAVNEELYSVSAEHRRKIDELTALTTDMEHLLRSTDVGTIFLDSHFCIRRFTPAVARVFHLLDRDIGRSIQDITPRFNHPGLMADIRAVMETGDIIERAVDVGASHFLIRFLPYRAAKGIEGIVLTMIDVPRLKEAEHALELRNQELAKVNGSLEQFTYIVAHDLRAPLRTIGNSAKWIIEDLGEDVSKDVREHCERLIAYANRLNNMLSDLMAYARLGSTESAIEDIDVNDLLKQIVETIDGEKRMSLDVQCALKRVRTRRAPLQLVLQNLVDNALKYSDRDKVKMTVRVEQPSAQMKITVTDDGPGIEPQHHDKIFLPFRKLENAEGKAGTGMGLALVKKAVEDNGGTIRVSSSPPELRGTAFIFTWDIA